MTLRCGLRIKCPVDQHALRAADPVRLHEAHFFRPLVEAAKRRQEFLGIVGDLEEPLGEFALLDERVRAPAAAIDHLFVGEHRMVDRIPVDFRGFPVGEPLRQQIDKQFLLVAIVFRRAGREFAGPVDR